MQPARMGPAGKLLNVCKGDRKIDFMGVARQSTMEKACLMIIFWGGLAESFRSRMPCWVPEDSLEDYINLALNLSGSAFRVELAAGPVPETIRYKAPSFREPTESASPQSPRAHRVRSASPQSPLREPTESAPGAHRVRSASPQSPLREPTESAPRAHRVRSASPQSPLREPTESAPGAHRVRSGSPQSPLREPTESAPGAHRVRSGSPQSPLREPTESAPRAHRVREPTESASPQSPLREPTESTHKAHKQCLLTVLFLPCWPFLFLNKAFHLQLDPDLCLHSDFSHYPVTLKL